MWKFIGKTVASMVLTKEARDAAGGLAKTAVRNAAQKMLPPGTVAPPEPRLPAPVLSEREELIRRAMEVRAAKQTVLAELNEEDRAKLVATAMRAFLAESKPEE